MANKRIEYMKYDHKTEKWSTIGKREYWVLRLLNRTVGYIDWMSR